MRKGYFLNMNISYKIINAYNQISKPQHMINRSGRHNNAAT